MNNNQTTNNAISFIIKKLPIKIFNFCVTGAVAIIIAFSGFVHDLWPLFIGMFGLMTLLGAAEAMYGETESVLQVVVFQKINFLANQINHRRRQCNY